eukprot:TRINITY_DN1657_c0_g1_i3.p1 TRINITY_DN1657_c0_g1~~TRINITY_DN1657_c0_g1_i3.p1  ORF type:complete len:696 (+),score=453.25 TRINITY_DN1657_c0_g1_i3:2-2089(+)
MVDVDAEAKTEATTEVTTEAVAIAEETEAAGEEISTESPLKKRGRSPSPRAKSKSPSSSPKSSSSSQSSSSSMKRSRTIDDTSAEAAAFLDYQGGKELLSLEKETTGARYETRSRQQARDAIDEIASMIDDDGDNRDEDDVIESWNEQAERRNLRTVFRIFAGGAATHIDEEHLTEVFRSLGKTPEKTKIRKVISSVGVDGKVSLSDFVEYMIERRKEKLSDKARALLDDSTSSSAADDDSTISSSPRGRSKSPTRKPKAKKATPPSSSKSPSSSPKPKVKKASSSKSPTPVKKAVATKKTTAASVATPKPKLSVFYNSIDDIVSGAGETFTNPEGDSFNLGVKGAFSDFHVLVYNGLSDNEDASSKITKTLSSLSASLGLHFETTDSITELYRRLSGGEADTMDAVWVISGSKSADDLWKDVTEDEFASSLHSFHKSGRGVVLFASSSPATSEANAILNKLFNNEPNAELSGDLSEAGLLHADGLTKTSSSSSSSSTKSSSFKVHPITNGLLTISEAPGYSSLKTNSTAFTPAGGFTPIAFASEGDVVLSVKESDTSSFPPTGRIVVDSSFRKFLTEGQGVDRLISNIAVWLLGVDVRLSSGLPLRGALNKMKCEYVWQYYHSGWYNYEKAASKLVEDCYQQYLLNPGKCDVRSVQSGHFSYQVDFINFKQTNVVHHAHTQRKIRRVPVSMSVF